MLALIRTLLKDEEVDYQSLLEISIADGKTMFAFRVNGSKAVDIWHRLRAALTNSKTKNSLKLSPVILGTEQSFELLMEHLGEGLEAGWENNALTLPLTSVLQFIAKGETIDCQNWLAERLERFVCPPGQWPAALKVGA